MSTLDNASVLCFALQAGWQLSSPSVSDILWKATRVDAATFLASDKNYAVCCYNPASPTQVVPLSREAWQQIEHVLVDVYVKVPSTSNPASAAATRESMRLQVYMMIHSQEFRIAGVKDAYVERETAKVEGPDLVRVTLQVACVSFHIVA